MATSNHSHRMADLTLSLPVGDSDVHERDRGKTYTTTVTKLNESPRSNKFELPACGKVNDIPVYCKKTTVVDADASKKGDVKLYTKLSHPAVTSSGGKKAPSSCTAGVPTNDTQEISSDGGDARGCTKTSNPLIKLTGGKKAPPSYISGGSSNELQDGPDGADNKVYTKATTSVVKLTGGKKAPSAYVFGGTSDNAGDDVDSEETSPRITIRPVFRTEPLKLNSSLHNNEAQKLSGGKRGPSGPIQTSSDEDSDVSLSPRTNDSTDKTGDTSLSLQVEACEHDHDYENVASPNSSTASGPTYDRQPGFEHHAHKVVAHRSKVKKVKKASHLVSLHGAPSLKKPEGSLKAKPKKDPLPMRLRALPQSFWQQPNVAHQVSPGTMFPVLPPLCNRDSEEDVSGPYFGEICHCLSILKMPAVSAVHVGVKDWSMDRVSEWLDSCSLGDITHNFQDIRPVSPNDESEKLKKSPREQPTERKITVANTDLLLKLFDGVTKEKKSSNHTKKISRARRIIPKSTNTKALFLGNDPYIVDAMTDKMFPQLTLDAGKQDTGGNSTLQIITLKQGDKCIALPTLNVEQNYPQMLSELAMTL